MRILPLMVISLLFSSSIVTPAHAANNTPVTHAEFDGLIREYLLKNPEAIIESVALYQKQEQTEGLKETSAAIAANKDALYNNPAIPTIGNKDAKVTVLEFFDYNCSACKYMFTVVDKQIKMADKDVRFIFMEFPIFGEQSEKLSKIGLAVHALAPEKYYDFHTHMMSHKGSITVDQAYEYATKVGLERASIEKELSNPKYEELRKANAELGAKLKVSGTPFLIIGDEPVPHALDATALTDYIDKAKAK